MKSLAAVMQATALLAALVLACAACQPIENAVAAAPAKSSAPPLRGDDVVLRFGKSPLGQPVAVVGLSVTNNTGQAVQAFKGRVYIADVLGDTLEHIEITNTQTIQPDEYVTPVGDKTLNRFIDRHKRLQRTPIDKLRFAWVTMSVVYADGTRWDASPRPSH